MISEEQQSNVIFELPVDLREVGKQLLSRFKKGALDVPLFPAIATEVMRLANSDDSDAAALAALIQTDPTLAGHVIRVANSPLYTPKASMISLQQAIARLGMRTICEISLSIALNTKLFNAPGFESRLSEISQHGFASALWAKEIARSAHMNVEASFLCGLLHGIGRAAFLQAYSDLSVMMKLNLEAAEVRSLEDALNPLFGQEINLAWEMPDVVCSAATYGNNYSECEKHRMQCAVVNAASMMASLSLDGASLDEVLSQDVFGELNLYQDGLHALVENRDQIIAAVRTQQL